VGITLSIANGGVGPTQISSVNVSQLNAGTMTVGSGGLTFSGSGGITVMGGGSVDVTPGVVYASGFGTYPFAGYWIGNVGSGTQVINSSGTFVGAGVNCPSSGICGAGFNPYVGGIQYTGQSYTLNFSGGFTVNGVTYHNIIFAGGVFVGLS
jgi:hypothetical protein